MIYVMKQWRFRVAVACMLVAGTAAWAGPPFEGGGPEPPRIAEMLERHAKEIGLEEETLAKIRSVVEAAKEEEQRLQGDVRDARRKLRDLLSADKPDEAAVMRQADELGARETAAMKVRLRTLLQVRPLLSDEQFAKLRELRHERMGPVFDACRDDVERLCGHDDDEFPPGRGVLRCLRRHSDELSPECRDALRDVRGPMRR